VKNKRVIIQKLENLDPHRGFAALLAVMAAPKGGYRFQSMERKETTATVRWVREENMGGLECPSK